VVDEDFAVRITEIIGSHGESEDAASDRTGR
jgi:hypothetical protein